MPRVLTGNLVDASSGGSLFDGSRLVGSKELVGDRTGRQAKEL